MLISRNVSSLVTDSLCDWVRGQNVSVACFYFNFVPQKEQPLTSMWAALPKQVVRGLEGVVERISVVLACEVRKKVISGPERGSSNVKLLQTPASVKPTFRYISAPDEYAAEN